ncbi:MAG TPA: class I SAM-dependent methyltransferase [Saprospiraceae bacterium]|nr:class I SAM-dependent methyltransferase [Saprospiraceae bacterium]
MIAGHYFYRVTLHEAIELIYQGVEPPMGVWADIGAGTGMFTLALMEILTEGKIIALDKSPHALYKIKAPSHLSLEIIDADFNQPLDLPELDGMVMANALHYAKDHQAVLQNVLASLKPGGHFILVEYDTDKPNEPWVPNPISLDKFRALCKNTGLSEPEEIARKKSIYNDGELYVAKTNK